MIAKRHYLTAVSLGNSDIAEYAAVSRYLKGFARTDTTGYFGQTGHIRWLADENHCGAFLSTAIASSLLSLETYQVPNINTHVFFVVSILMFYVLARTIFQYNYYSALGITALYSLNPIIYFTAYEVFQAQIIATGLALGLILINVQAINDCRTRGDYYSYVPFAILLNWGLIITYSHVLPLVYIPVIVYVLLIAFYVRSGKPILNWASFLLVALIVVVALSPPRARSLVSQFLLYSDVNVGFFVRWLSPEGWYGLTFEKLDEYLTAPPLRFVLSLPLTILFAAGFRSAYRKDKKLLLLVASSTLPILAGYFLLSYLGRTGSLMGGYKSYKLLSFFLPLILLGLSIMFRGLTPSRKNWVSNVLALALIILVGWAAVSCYHIVKLMALTPRAVERNVSDLRGIESISEVKSINIVDSDWWHVMWEANFLLRKKLFFRISTYSSYPASELAGQWSLESADPRSNDILAINGFDKKSIPVNESYLLVQRSALSAQFGEGWYEFEGTHRWMGSNLNSASVILQSGADNLAIDIHLRYWALSSGNSLDVQLNGRKLADCGRDQCNINQAVLFKGRNILRFKTSLPPMRPNTLAPGNNDVRTLSYAFQAIDIEPSKATR